MRLTTSDKEAFVRAVMNDVPEKDYAEQRREYVRQCAVKLLPKELAAAIDAGYADALNYVSVKTHKGSSLGNHAIGKSVTLTAQQSKKAERLRRQEKDQDSEHRMLKSKIRALIDSVNTLKQAKDTLPEELHKYLPADRSKTSAANLPAIAGAVDDLKKHGWPKPQQTA